MTSYDSDSSLDDSLDVQTNVTLGYATAESTGDDVSHVGGHPTWLDELVKPSAALSRCEVCNSHMSLLLQLQADLQQHFPNDERRLFIWCCRKKQCSKKVGSVRTFREVKKAKTSRKRQTTPSAQQQTSQSQQRIDLGSQLFGGSPAPTSSNNANPFASTSLALNSTTNNPFSTSSQANGNPFSSPAPTTSPTPQPPIQTFADKLKISSPAQEQQPEPAPEPWPSESTFPQPLPHFYLDAESEYLEPTPIAAPGPSNSQLPHPENNFEDEIPSSSTGAANTTEKDLYESPHDKTFEHFSRILAQNPEQILRYEFRGSPLLYSSSDAVATHFVLPGHNLHQSQKARVKTSGPVKGIPSCQHCGAARVFEMQLVPYLIYELEKDNEEAMKLDGGEGMEWGTIIVGTCSKNCGDEDEGNVVFREEWVGVQWEEGGVQLKQKK